AEPALEALEQLCELLGDLGLLLPRFRDRTDVAPLEAALLRLGDEQPRIVRDQIEQLRRLAQLLAGRPRQVPRAPHPAAHRAASGCLSAPRARPAPAASISVSPTAAKKRATGPSCARSCAMLKPASKTRAMSSETAGSRQAAAVISSTTCVLYCSAAIHSRIW